jgi:hypothetical protein
MLSQSAHHNNKVDGESRQPPMLLHPSVLAGWARSGRRLLQLLLGGLALNAVARPTTSPCLQQRNATRNTQLQKFGIVRVSTISFDSNAQFLYQNVIERRHF